MSFCYELLKGLTKLSRLDDLPWVGLSLLFDHGPMTFMTINFLNLADSLRILRNIVSTGMHSKLPELSIANYIRLNILPSFPITMNERLLKCLIPE